MEKLLIIYWSGTGNTETMASIIADEAKAQGVITTFITASEYSEDILPEHNKVALGCSANGSEELEPSEFQPMWEDIRNKLSGKKVVLFGSYGWGGGEYLETWKEEAVGLGIDIVGTVVCNEAPDDEAEENCKALVKTLL